MINEGAVLGDDKLIMVLFGWLSNIEICREMRSQEKMQNLAKTVE